MEEKTYTFSSFNDGAKNGISCALNACCNKNERPLIVCVGSDLVLGDSLGPLVGTFLRKNGVSAYVYGTLNSPITAKEIEYAKKYLSLMHPNTITIAVDAAIGDENDIGLIRVFNKGLKPGLGVDKNLGVLGEVSIVGIVAPKSVKNYSLFNLTRLNLIYKMAETISQGITEFIKSKSPNIWLYR